MMRNLTLPTWKCPFAMNLNHETELASSFLLDVDATQEAATFPPTGYSKYISFSYYKANHFFKFVLQIFLSLVLACMCET